MDYHFQIDILNILQFPFSNIKLTYSFFYFLLNQLLNTGTSFQIKIHFID